MLIKARKKKIHNYSVQSPTIIHKIILLQNFNIITKKQLLSAISSTKILLMTDLLGILVRRRPLTEQVFYYLLCIIHIILTTTPKKSK